MAGQSKYFDGSKYKDSNDRLNPPKKRPRGRPAKGGKRVTIRFRIKTITAALAVSAQSGKELSQLVDEATWRYVLKLQRIARRRHDRSMVSETIATGKPPTELGPLNQLQVLRDALAEAEMTFGPSHARARVLRDQIRQLEDAPQVSGAPQSQAGSPHTPHPH